MEKFPGYKKEDPSTLLDSNRVNLIQRFIGNFYYYAQSVDHKILVTLGELTTKQTLGIGTEKVMGDVVLFKITQRHIPVHR